MSSLYVIISQYTWNVLWQKLNLYSEVMKNDYWSQSQVWIKKFAILVEFLTVYKQSIFGCPGKLTLVVKPKFRSN